MIEKISSEHDKGQGSIGSVLYANSFCYFDENNHINLTEGVPNLLQWHTNWSHYMNTAKMSALHQPADNWHSPLLGKQLDHQKDVLGFMPVKSELESVIKRDVLTHGRVSFHEHGLMYSDERLGMFIVPFTSCRHITAHMDGVNDWLQVTMNQFEGKNMLPAQLIAEESFYLRLKGIDKHFNAIKAIFDSIKQKDKDAELPTLEKSFDKCDRVRKSFSILNFDENKKVYEAQRGSEFANFSFKRAEWRELFDFQAIQEFNLLRGKVFVPFNQFADAYREVSNKPRAVNLESTKD
jgi:hypothetical protein